MKTLITLILILFNFHSLEAQANDIRNINKSKIVSKASYNLNNTNLIDIENAQNLFDNINAAVTPKKPEPIIAIFIK